VNFLIGVKLISHFKKLELKGKHTHTHTKKAGAKWQSCERQFTFLVSILYYYAGKTNYFFTRFGFFDSFFTRLGYFRR